MKFYIIKNAAAMRKGRLVQEIFLYKKLKSWAKKF